ncbi:hypothetical protein LBMAG53_03950 [Planctomycetota bacterium]|nr:hypothetical protein LBMAG53_03950 [Planctomycetota bacterium]
MSSLRGYQAAMDRAREIAANDRDFCLAADQSLIQGKNNRVLCGFYQEQPAVLKYFNDGINKPNSLGRKSTEAFSLRHFSGINGVPALYAEHDDCLIMERIAGSSFASEITARENGPGIRTFLDRIGSQIGRTYARFSAVTFSPEERVRLTAVFQQESIAKRLADLVSQAQELCQTEGLRDFSNTLDTMQRHLPDVLKEDVLLYKYDNNFENMLIRDADLVGVVDFEQCYLGSETVFLGAILDTIPDIYPMFPNRPSWESVMSAYALERGIHIDPVRHARIVAMAMLNHWQRIVERHVQHGHLDGFLVRFRSRFETLNKMLLQE